MSEREDFADALAASAKADPFAVIYRAKVIVQHADGTVDLRLAGTKLEPRNVRLDVGIPGCRVIVDPGTEVKLAFSGGEPDGAYAFGIPLDPAASSAFSLVGDLVDGGWIEVTAPAGTLGGPCLITLTAPGFNNVSLNAAQLVGRVSGPGHKYAKGVSGP